MHAALWNWYLVLLFMSSIIFFVFYVYNEKVQQYFDTKSFFCFNSLTIPKANFKIQTLTFHYCIFFYWCKYKIKLHRKVTALTSPQHIPVSKIKNGTRDIRKGVSVCQRPPTVRQLGYAIHLYSLKTTLKLLLLWNLFV